MVQQQEVAVAVAALPGKLIQIAHNDVIEREFFTVAFEHVVEIILGIVILQRIGIQLAADLDGGPRLIVAHAQASQLREQQAHADMRMVLAQQRQQLVPLLAEQKLLPDRVIVPVLKEDKHAVLILHHAVIGHVAPRAQLQHHVPRLRGGRLLVELDIAEAEVARLRQAQATRTVAHQLRILLPIAQEIMDHLLALRHALAVKARLAEVMVELLGKAAEQLLIHHRRQPAREIAAGKGIKHPVGNVGAQDHGVVADIRRH